jgi:hypothetical protein
VLLLLFKKLILNLEKNKNKKLILNLEKNKNKKLILNLVKTYIKSCKNKNKKI